MAQDSNTTDALLQRWIVMATEFGERMRKLYALIDGPRDEQHVDKCLDVDNQKEGE